jgi:hypothetical protein
MDAVPEKTAQIIKYINMQDHFYLSLNKGKIALSDIVFNLSLIALGLFTGTVAVETRRWR